MRVSCRPVMADDVPFLWEMLFRASHSYEDAQSSVAAIRSDPALARYVSGWPRRGDLGVIGEIGGEPAGAAWLRLIVGEERRSPAFVDDDTPEIAVAVAAGREGQGLGTTLLTQLLAQADAVHAQTTLNARADNPAVRLYERLGFATVEVIVNRVGTPSVKMIRRRPPRGGG